MSRSFDGTALDEVVRTAVERGEVPHLAVIAADADGVFYEGAAGVRVAGGSDDPVTTSTQFRIMSMTKTVCTVAALQQVERGELDLDAPVADHCPEWKDLQVLDGWDGDTPRLRAPHTTATVRHLVTHTSGLSYWFWNADLARYEALTGVPNVVPGSARAFEAPLVVDPGTRFEYGISTDWLGRVVESVAGATLDRVVIDGATGPLGMPDTMFRLDPARLASCVSVHLPGEQGGWVSAGELLNQEPDWWAGGHGLYSTPRDYVRFERALLRGGELDGTRVLRQDTVDAAFSGQIGELTGRAEIPTADPATSDALPVGPGHTWGYGLLLNTADVPGGRRAGTGAWAGLLNTHFIDRASGVCASVYSNCLPFVAEHGAWETNGDVERALYAALG